MMDKEKSGQIRKSPGKGKVKTRLRDSFDNPIDRLQYSLRKINFVRDIFSHNVPNGELLSEDGITGLTFILGDIENDLELVSDEISKERNLRT